jgi:hypothetical protein
MLGKLNMVKALDSKRKIYASAKALTVFSVEVQDSDNFMPEDHIYFIMIFHNYYLP